MILVDNTIQSGLMSKEQAALYLGVSVSTIDRHIKKGSLKVVKVGRIVRFRKEDLEFTLNTTPKSSN